MKHYDYEELLSTHGRYLTRHVDHLADESFPTRMFTAIGKTSLRSYEGLSMCLTPATETFAPSPLTLQLVQKDGCQHHALLVVHKQWNLCHVKWVESVNGHVEGMTHRETRWTDMPISILELTTASGQPGVCS
jgi:hypothetical protein